MNPIKVKQEIENCLHWFAMFLYELHSFPKEFPQKPHWRLLIEIHKRIDHNNIMGPPLSWDTKFNSGVPKDAI